MKSTAETASVLCCVFASLINRKNVHTIDVCTRVGLHLCVNILYDPECIQLEIDD